MSGAHPSVVLRLRLLLQLPHLQLAFPAFGKARNVMLAGARDIAPGGAGIASRFGSASAGPS